MRRWDSGRDGVGRRIASWWLQTMLRYAPAASQAWFEAMLGELEFVEGDWAALFWALGCTSVVLREWMRVWAVWIGGGCAVLFGNQPNEEGKMNATGRKTLGVLSGIGIALALGVGAFFIAPSIAKALQSVGVPRTAGMHLLTILVPTELVLAGAAIWLWRHRKAPVAVGILATGLAMAGHIVVFLIQR